MFSKSISNRSTLAVLITVLSLFALDTNAHEFWVEPTKYEIEKGASIKANLRNGQDFRGAAFPYVKDTTVIYSITNSASNISPKQRTGNNPAFDYITQNDGLHIASYQGSFDTLDFKTWDKFTHYVENQSFDGMLERHKQRGLPQTNFKEQYARCAKALIQVGDGTQGEDKLTGLKYELVANKNPYTLMQNDTLPVTLFYEGKPTADRQIQVFRDDGVGDVTNFKIRTDKNGNANIDLKGGGKFMLNSVYIYEGDEDPKTELAAYQSYWATLTFGIMGTDELLDN